jgi:hypothetical protein
MIAIMSGSAKPFWLFFIVMVIIKLLQEYNKIRKFERLSLWNENLPTPCTTIPFLPKKA